MYFKRKRGISPLIATVLLVGFTIALILLVILWGRAYVRDKAEKEGELSAEQLKCSTGVEIEILDVSPRGEVKIRNTGSEDIKGFVLRYKKDGDESGSTWYKVIKAGNDGSIDVDLSVDEIKIIPALRPSGRGAPSVPCSNKVKKLSLGG